MGTPQEGRIDPLVRARARQIAARLALRRPRRDASTSRGAGDLASVPYAGGSDDVDLDRTLEILTERPLPEDEDIIVRERMRTRRSVVLAVDVSGSMRGERIRTAAAAVGALAGELSRDHLAVLAFWSDAAKLLDLGATVHPLQVLDDLLRIPAQGLTNVAFPLQMAARELARVPVRDARVLLLSDCVHNAGPDPEDRGRSAAAPGRAARYHRRARSRTRSGARAPRPRPDAPGTHLPGRRAGAVGDLHRLTGALAEGGDRSPTPGWSAAAAVLRTAIPPFV